MVCFRIHNSACLKLLILMGLSISIAATASGAIASNGFDAQSQKNPGCDGTVHTNCP